jgi:hypothetical protein
MNSFSEVLALWPTLSELAADLDLPYGVVKQWRRRNSIPSDKWQALVLAAQRRGHRRITAELLTSIAARRPAASTQAA